MLSAEREAGDADDGGAGAEAVREQYIDLNVRHFHEKQSGEHGTGRRSKTANFLGPKRYQM